MDVVFKDDTGSKSNLFDSKDITKISYSLNKKSEVIDEVVSKYQTGFRTKDLAKLYFCCDKTILNYITKWCEVNVRDVDTKSGIVTLTGPRLRQYIRLLNKKNRHAPKY